MRAIAPAAVLALVAVPATAREAALPKAMIGVWAREIAECRDKDGVVEDGRAEVTAGSVEFFASGWRVRRWHRTGESYQGRASVAEEGEDRPAQGRYPIALRLLSDGRLQIRLERNAAELYVKCPAGTNVR